MNYKQYRIIISLFLAFTFSFSVSFSEGNIFQEIRKFSDVLNLANRNYVDSVNTNQLTEAAIIAMLKQLDPHSIYLPPKEKENEEEQFRGNYPGVGIMFRMIKDTITVLVPIIGGESERIGIRCSDKIVTINGENAVGIPMDSVPKLLKGPEGTKVSVSVQRQGTPGMIPFTITRGPVPLKTIDACYILEGTDIGYIYLNKFAETTYFEFIKAAKELKAKGMKKLILDLRWNPGGIMTQATAIIDEFIDGKKKILYTQGRRSDMSEDFYSTPGGEFKDIPLVVLINYSSASASEIVAGAIQDLDRGVIVGTTSFGKGLVQRQYPLEDGSAFRLTIARYYTPSGRCIQRDYSDRGKYYSMEGVTELKEGENFEHTGEQDTTRPHFKTSRGRIVLGGGGIVPDYVVSYDTIGNFASELLKQGVVTSVVDEYILTNGNEIRKTYNKELDLFLKSFSIDDNIISMLKQKAEEKKVPWNDVAFAEEKEQIDRIIRVWITNYIWSTSNEFLEAYIRVKQIDKAIEMFPEAEKLAQLYRNAK